MQYILHNDYLTATFLSKGAELCKLVDTDGINYIWSADPAYWSRHAPVLFPFVGKVTDGQYNLNDTNYQIGQHGFARDMEFTVTEQNDNALTFTLISNEQTKMLYPFDFKLDIIYTLKNKSLSIAYKVINTDLQTIAFKIGAHPGFMCPLFEGETMEDYYLEFESYENTTLMLLTPEGLFTHDLLPFTGQTIDLSPDTFIKDALVFKDLASTCITLCSKKHDKKLSVSFDGFPLLGIWSPHTRSPFVCIEPWFGHADFVDDSSNLLEKKDLVTLAAHNVFECEHIIHIH